VASRREQIAQRPKAPVPWPVQRLHLLFDAVGDVGLAALLRELGRALYNREIHAWGVLVDISDELLERATASADQRLTDKWLKVPRKPPALMAARRAQRRSRKLRA
jgi:hypothetical protein